MQRVTIEVEFVTPCFLGGADPEQSAEWRAESIRGQLRWWFRAVAARDFAFDIQRVREAEEAAWGSTTRKSAFDVVVEPLEQGALQSRGVPFMNTIDPREGRGRETINGPVYLGYGLFDHVQLPSGRKEFQTRRPYIVPGRKARFHLVRRGTMTAQEVNAIHAWLWLGGIGSRSRRGYGSLAFTTATGIDTVQFAGTRPAVLRQPEARRIDTEGTLRELPPFPAISDFTRVCKWNEAFQDRNGVEGWRRALHAAGKALIKFRRRYQRGTPPTLDYEWAYGQGGNEQGLPHRVGFGLPLPFGKPVILHGVDHDRRASPLLIHIALERGQGEMRYRPIFTFLPSRFLPGQEQVAFFRKRGDDYVRSKGVFPVGLDQYRIVQTFLDGLTSGPNAAASEGL